MSMSFASSDPGGLSKRPTKLIRVDNTEGSEYPASQTPLPQAPQTTLYLTYPADSVVLPALTRKENKGSVEFAHTEKQLLEDHLSTSITWLNT